MDFSFESITYTREAFLADALPGIPKSSAVYKIFDTHGKLIVLDKTSNLFQRLERFYGIRSEMVRDLDLREITSRIDFVRTSSPFETMVALYRERRQQFPRTYRKMRTFRFFTLMKVNRKQRFPRVYASRQIKSGVDYFGPFISRGQFNRLKTALERTFKLRPCLFNIRGGDPHSDCMYFQMHTCSRPCNDDIDRGGYLQDVNSAMAFIEGLDEAIEQPILQEITALAAEMKFEEAEAARKRMEKVKRSRQDEKDTFFPVWKFNYLVLLPSTSTSLCKIAFVREGNIVTFKEYETATLGGVLESDVRDAYTAPMNQVNREWQYDEFCMVCNFIVDPLKSVTLIPVTTAKDLADLPAEVLRRLEGRRKKSKTNDDR